MSSEQKAIINQRRREAYRAKKVENPSAITAKNREPSRKLGKREYKRRLKDLVANNLHNKDSCAIMNTSFTPKLVFPNEPRLYPIHEYDVPDLSVTPRYVPPSSPQVDDMVTPSTEIGTSSPTKSPRRRHVSPGERHTFRSRQNQRFESTIGKNTFGLGVVDEDDTIRPTRSTVGDQGN